MLFRLLCLRNGNPDAAAASLAVAKAVRELNLPEVEVVESDSTHFHPMNAVVGCDRLAIVDDAAKATPHYKLIAEAFEAAADMNLGVPADIVILAIENTSGVAGIVARIREFAAIASGNRRDSSMCRTDICDVCVGESACTDRLVVRPEPAK
jgi:hypothetical protein